MTKKTWLTPISIVGLMTLYALVYAWQPWGDRPLKILTDTLYVTFTLCAAILAFIASRRFEPGVRARYVWLLLGVGMAVVASAQVLWTFQHTLLNKAGTFPALIDLLWSIGYIPILASLLLQYRALGVGTSLRFKLMVLAIYLIALVGAAAILGWTTTPDPSRVTTTEILVIAYYLVGDLGLVFTATLSLAILWNGLVGRPWQYIVISMLLLAMADLTFAYGVLNQMYATGSNLLSGLVDTIYLTAFATAAAGAYHQITLSLPPLDADELALPEQ